MFYKNLEHYENTLKKILRNEFDFEIDFETDWGYCFLSAMYESSDREQSNCVGYDLMCYVKHRCENQSEVMNVLNICKDKSRAITEYTDWGMKIIQNGMREALDSVGYKVRRVRI